MVRCNSLQLLNGNISIASIVCGWVLNVMCRVLRSLLKEYIWYSLDIRYMDLTSRYWYNINKTILLYYNMNNLIIFKYRKENIVQVYIQQRLCTNLYFSASKPTSSKIDFAAYLSFLALATTAAANMLYL